MTEVLFYAMHLPVLPLWGAWIFAPGSSASRYFASALWPFGVLAAMYVALILNAMFIVGGAPGASMASLPGVMAIFDGPWTVLACWMHYLCFDALAARWIVNDAQAMGRHDYKLSPIIALTCFFGPAGFLLYLCVRPRLKAGRGDAVGLLELPDEVRLVAPAHPLGDLIDRLLGV